VKDLLGVDLASLEQPDYAEKRSRPDALQGVSQRIDTGYGKLYVTINEDSEGRPFELFANIGHSGGFTNSFTEALAKVISTALRSGVDPYEIVDELKGTRSPKVAWDKGEQINSIPDAIGTAMWRYLEDQVDKPYPQQETLDEIEGETRSEPEQAAPEQGPETDGGGVAVEAESETDSTQSLIDAGESPECPECGSMDLYYSEGCKTCQSCGWSECS
jgi:ribonucleoside-diphosphate reductase alpha chain